MRTAHNHKWSSEDLALLEELAGAESRENFFAYRRYMGGVDLRVNWWIKETAQALQLFYEAYTRGERPKLLLMAPPQHGKALSLDTPIATPSGWTTMGELEVGDQVFGDDGNPCNVVAVSPVWRNREVYRVLTDDGDEIIADAEHEWAATIIDHARKRLYTTEELFKQKHRKGPVSVRVDSQGALKLPERTLSIDPYVLGVWLGNGDSASSDITILDDEVVESVLALEGGGNISSVDLCKDGVRTVKRVRPGPYSFKGTSRVEQSKSLHSRLRALGLLYNKHIPQEYLRASVEQRWALLQGLIDTDGYVAPDGQIEFGTKFEWLAQQVKELVHSLGHKVSIIHLRSSYTDKNGQAKDCGPFYAVMFYAKGAAKLSRKAVKTRNGIKTFRRYLAVEKAGRAHTICIEVDSPSHMFLCGRSMLPTHNSRMVTDFISWVSGKNPHTRSIFTSYSEDLGVKTNAALQRLFTDRRYRIVFSELTLPAPSDIGKRTFNQLDFIGYDGSFRNTTVLGQVTGLGLDLGVIDDPIKGRKEASSETVRESTWNWLTDDFFTRFSEHAGLLIVMTRWHKDDPAGRFLDKFPDTIVLDYPAVAIKDEPHRKKGEALFPEFKSMEFLKERRALLTKSSWESLYQQSPIIAGGGMFPIDKFGITQAMPNRTQIRRMARYWDKAGSHNDGAYTAGTKMAQLMDDSFVVVDVRRGQWSAFEREEVIKQTADLDGVTVPVVVEQEPGSGGKESAERSIRMLSGYIVSADKVTGNKEFRAEPYAAQVQAGNVKLLSATWNRQFIDEHEEFPNGPYADQVDSAAGAFAKLTLGTRYDSSMRWVTG